jgi:hypothetical protein
MAAKKTALQEAAAKLMESIEQEARAHEPKARALLKAITPEEGK